MFDVQVRLGGMSQLLIPALLLSLAFLLHLNLLEPWGAEVIQQERNEVNASADAKENGITGGHIVAFCENVEEPARENGKHKAPCRPCHTP